MMAFSLEHVYVVDNEPNTILNHCKTENTCICICVCVCCTCCKDSQILFCNPKPFYSWLEIKGIHPVGSICPILCTNVLAVKEQTYGSHFPYTKHGWVKSHLGKGFFDLQEPEWFREKEYGPAVLFRKCQWSMGQREWDTYFFQY